MLKANEIRHAAFASWLPEVLAKPRKAKGARGRGLRYEKQVSGFLLSQHEDFYVPFPWLEYKCGNGVLQFAQPDGLLFNFEAGTITVVEIKYQHTAEAYYQIFGKYLPILQKIFPLSLWSYRTVEVVKWFDPMTRFPCSVKLRPGIDKAQPREFGVFIWKP